MGKNEAKSVGDQNAIRRDKKRAQKAQAGKGKTGRNNSERSGVVRISNNFGEESEAASIPRKMAIKTSAVPRSGCLKINKNGTPTKPSKVNRSNQLVIFLRSEKKAASEMIKASLEISEG
jgi:hypothetical protein